MKDSKYIDHTLLKAFATKSEIEKLCSEAIKYDFKSVCINPGFVSYCKEKLKNTDVLVCTVIGFPLGANTTEVKVFETKDALAKGADEIDMVVNISKIKDNDLDYVYNEIKLIKEACGNHTLKVILETCYLTKEEIKNVSELAVKANADFVKTSTGFGSGGATIEDVLIMKAAAKDKEVKASGGVRTKEDFEKMKQAGATRIGTSNGVSLIEGENNESSNTAY